MSYRDAVMAAKYAGGSNEQATALHERRFETVATGEGYFDFDAARGIVVHVVPDGVYDDGYAIDLSEHAVLPEANPSRPTQLPVLGHRDARGTWTANGFGSYVGREPTGERESDCAGYAHLFSNGVVEAVSALPFDSDASNDRLDGREIELDLTRCVRRYVRLLAYHQRMAPIHVAFGVYGVDGWLLGAGVEPDDADTDAREMRESLLAPFPVTLSNFDADVRAELADPIDALWRGAGYPGSPFFGDGEWSLRTEFEGAR